MNTLVKPNVDNRLTTQETFDFIVSHLRSQRGRAIEGGPDVGWDWEGNACRYRDSAGRACAVGCLIPDDEVGALSFKGTVEDLLDRYPQLESIVPVGDNGLKLLTELQGVHDNHGNWKGKKFRGEFQLKQVAMNYDLIYSPPVRRWFMNFRFFDSKLV